MTKSFNHESSHHGSGTFGSYEEPKPFNRPIAFVSCSDYSARMAGAQELCLHEFGEFAHLDERGELRVYNVGQVSAATYVALEGFVRVQTHLLRRPSRAR